MAAITLDRVVKRYGDGFAGRQRRQPGDRRRRAHDPGRPVGVRQVDPAAHDRRPRGHHLRRRAHRRPARQRAGAARPQPGDGVPELRPLPAPDGVREHRLPAPPRRARLDEPSCAGGSRTPPTSSSCASTWSAARRSSPAASASASRWAAPSSARRDAFLFDEPLSNLDAKLRGQMRAEIARLQRRLRMTTVYVTHDQTEAMTLGDRVAVLRKGVLQQVATPRQLYEAPVNCSSPGSSASPPMNFVPATIEGRTTAAAVRDRPARRRRRRPGRRPLAAGRRHAPGAASRTPPWSTPTPARRGVTFEATVDVTEWLGNQQFAYVPFDRRRRRRRPPAGAAPTSSTATRCARSWWSHRPVEPDPRRGAPPSSGSTPRTSTSSTRPAVRT